MYSETNFPVKNNHLFVHVFFFIFSSSDSSGTVLSDLACDRRGQYYSIKELLFDICTSEDILKLDFEKYDKDISRYECIKMREALEKLTPQWTLKTKLKIRTKFNCQKPALEQQKRSFMKCFIMFVQKSITQDIRQFTNFEKCLVNEIMMCDPDAELKQLEKSDMEIWDDELKCIQMYYASTAKKTYKQIQLAKLTTKFLKFGNETVDKRLAKVIYYLRNIYKQKIQKLR